MKAKIPVQYRFVKVKTTGEDSDEEITAKMLTYTLDGSIPTWEEIPDEDTPELDTETIFEEKTFPKGKDPAWDFLPQRKMHQTTIPLPVDVFGSVLSRMTAKQAGLYCMTICNREKWPKDYSHFMMVLNNLDMEMSEGLRD